MPAAVRSSMSLATPSSISRDLRTPSPRLSTVNQHQTYGSSVPASPLLLPSADGELSKICGSLVEPEDSRQRWACHGCKAVFPRDATIYLAPPSPSQHKPLGDATSALNRRVAATSAAQEHFCKSCYTERFAMGTCFACAKPVLGSTKEDGKYVKSGMDGHIWHGRCWKCTACGAAGADKDVSLGLDGTPVCAQCFDLPRPRKNVPLPPSPFKENTSRRISPPTSSLSGSATRQGMGATIAELSRKFGHVAPPPSSSPPKTSPVLSQASGRESPTRNGLTRSNSITNGIRPLTAQFSGQSFNLAAFRPTKPTLARSDSRSRSTSPTKDLQEEICAKCFRGPFDAPSGPTQEARMVSLHGGAIRYHAECFCCAICDKPLENAKLSFVRLEEGLFAHPSCAPPATVTRQTQMLSHTPTSMTPSSSSEYEHATHQRQPRPSLTGDAAHHNLPSSYLTGGGSNNRQSTSSVSSTSSSSVSSSAGTRRFQPTSGAAPPTRSTLLHQRPPGHQAVHANASLAVSSTNGIRAAAGGPAGRFGRLGGMQVCGGCNVAVSSLEGVPGPRGQSWHRKCLVCSAPPAGQTTTAFVPSRLSAAAKMCGKQLDSSAKVNAEGQLRCRACYDKDNARHRVAT